MNVLLNIAKIEKEARNQVLHVNEMEERYRRETQASSSISGIWHRVRFFNLSPRGEKSR